MKTITTRPETKNIQELATALAEPYDLTKARSKAILEGLRDEIVQTLLAGKRVNLFGLGTFEVRSTREKTGRNPKTGEKVQIPAGRKIAFKVSKGLKDQL